MKYLNKSFNFFCQGNKDYSKNYDRIFRKTIKQRISEIIKKILYNLFIKGE
jgi:hypothetical protein